MGASSSKCKPSRSSSTERRWSSCALALRAATSTSASSKSSRTERTRSFSPASSAASALASCCRSRSTSSAVPTSTYSSSSDDSTMKYPVGSWTDPAAAHSVVPPSAADPAMELEPERPPLSPTPTPSRPNKRAMASGSMLRPACSRASARRSSTGKRFLGRTPSRRRPPSPPGRSSSLDSVRTCACALDDLQAGRARDYRKAVGYVTGPCQRQHGAAW
ncbi:uncharacterized protein DKFZp434B061-like [Panicum hallii]|uniref:uncharacterized protein DKFZp434B061-like n=1 Tax=Panicum hallii TaxID=206008 RepID=UPI000DF4D60D|nr:uncharacterized protein DKFZp434B061-like [Panicum hallii]